MIHGLASHLMPWMLALHACPSPAGCACHRVFKQADNGVVLGELCRANDVYVRVERALGDHRDEPARVKLRPATSGIT